MKLVVLILIKVGYFKGDFLGEWCRTSLASLTYFLTLFFFVLSWFLGDALTDFIPSLPELCIILSLFSCIVTPEVILKPLWSTLCLAHNVITWVYLSILFFIGKMEIMSAKKHITCLLSLTQLGPVLTVWTLDQKSWVPGSLKPFAHL